MPAGARYELLGILGINIRSSIATNAPQKRKMLIGETGGGDGKGGQCVRSLHFCSVFCRAITALQLAYECGCRSRVLYEGMDVSMFFSEHVTLHFPSVPPKFRGPMRLFSVPWDHPSLSLVPMAACLPFLRTSVNQFSALERIGKHCLFSMALGCGQWQSFVGSQLPPAPLVGTSIGADKPTWWLCHAFLSEA